MTVELVLRVPQALVDMVSDALVDELDAQAVSVEDADAGTQQEQALFGEPGMVPPVAGWQRSWVRALFADTPAAEGAATVLLTQSWGSQLQLYSIEPVAEQDWVKLTQAQFSPVEITASFWVVPSWHEVPNAAQHFIRLDPGLAFGTGTHPTTRMCLRWLASHSPSISSSWDRVLDYGCGSGILSIGAALMGGRGIDAVDIDPDAVRATQANAAANKVVVNAGLPSQAQGRYPLVLANILATPLKILAPVLSQHVAAGGWLVLAGILGRQAEELREAYAPWLELAVEREEEGWILMTAQAPLADR